MGARESLAPLDPHAMSEALQRNEAQSRKVMGACRWPAGATEEWRDRWCSWPRCRSVHHRLTIRWMGRSSVIAWPRRQELNSRAVCLERVRSDDAVQPSKTSLRQALHLDVT